MRILHTADWHLGRMINGYSLIELQKDMIDKIEKIIVENNVDVVALAGDIYDRAIPSVEATNLFNKFLTHVAIELKKQIIIISGNHDSYERLRFGNDIFKQVGIYIANNDTSIFDKLSLYDEYGVVNFYLWPYCSYYLLKERYQDENFKTYNDCFEYLIKQNSINTSERNCFIGHSYYTYGMEKCLESDSERQLSVGGMDYLDTKLLKDFDIAMFGHLHGPQKVGSPYHRYAGTPLKYSFSEVRHHKSVTIFELKEKGDITFEEVEIQPLRDMKIIKGYLQDIVRDGVNGIDKEDLIKVILLDEDKIFEPMSAIRTRYPNVLELSYEKTIADQEQIFEKTEQAGKLIPELFFDFYEKINNSKVTEAEEKIIREVYETLLRGDEDENH